MDEATGISLKTLIPEAALCQKVCVTVCVPQKQNPIKNWTKR